MGGKKGFSTNRSEFSSGNPLDGNIEYERGGGCFVTTRRAIVYFLVAILASVIVGLFVYFYGPDHKSVLGDGNSLDIEKLLNDSINNVTSNEDFRLPTHLRPIHYRLRLHPYLDEPSENNFTFTGQVTILFQCTNKTKKIVLNSDELDIFPEHISVISIKDTNLNVSHIMPPNTSVNESNLQLQTGQVITYAIKNQESVKKMSRYVITLTKNLEPGLNYTLDMQFSGKIINNLVGLYKTSYLDPDGQKRWLLTTQFQPIYSRRVFPCFDEPSFKARFEISIARRNHMISLSNAPLKRAEPMVNEIGWIWDHFEETPPMSSYLVVLTVCDFESVSASTATAPEFKVWAPKHLLSKTKYALEVGPKILQYFEKYFALKYPLPKLDLIAVPELSQRALENWGLISFRDTSILLDPESTNLDTKNHIFKAIAREIAQQWFGNLVTMDWWSEQWLSEGFTTYMEDLVENTIDPSLEILDPFSLRITQSILELDELKSVRSVNAIINDPGQIELLYDDVAYNKGGCLIRMLSFTITEDIFRRGVQQFLKKWMYKCSNQDEFWLSLTEVSANNSVFPSEFTIKNAMDSWINQEGYPLVTVTRDYTTGNAIINQTRFAYEYSNEEAKNLWYVPLTYTTSYENGVVTTLWLKKEESVTVFNFTQLGNDSWILFNVEQAGFYRVNYDITNWKLIQLQLMNDLEKISPSNRGQLLNDAFELANSKILNYKIAFELTKYLGPKERSYMPWYSVINSLQTLQYNLQFTEHNGIFQDFIVKLIKPVYDELGTTIKPDESQNDKALRSFAIKIACFYAYQPCLEWAKDQYKQWMVSAAPDQDFRIPADLRQVVECTSIKAGGRKEWDFLWQRTLNPSISQSNLKIAYHGLGCTREPWIINSYLEKSLNGSISLQNVPYVWKSVAHPVGLSIGFQFLRLNWDRIYNKNQHIFTNLNSIFEDFLSRLSTEIDLEDLTLFYKDNSENLHPVSHLILSVVNRIKSRISWRKSHMQTVAAWLLKNNQK